MTLEDKIEKIYKRYTTGWINWSDFVAELAALVKEREENSYIKGLKDALSIGSNYKIEKHIKFMEQQSAK